jgi:hypothetical protein
LPGRGLLTVACLVLIALVCLSALRRLEREWRLLSRLRRANRGEMALAQLAPLDQLSARSLAEAGVVSLADGYCRLNDEGLRTFRTRRMRVLIAGGVGGALLAVLVAITLLHL